jgi:hypothetical protein
MESPMPLMTRLDQRAPTAKPYRLTRWALSAMAGMFGLYAATADGRAEPRQAPNSRVALELGEAFSPSDRFSGFVDEKSGASFIVVEMPASAYEEVKQIADSADALAAQGLRQSVKSELPGRKGEYVYFTGKQTAVGSEFTKFVLILRENGVTAMVTANIPEAALTAATFTKAQIEETLAKAAVKDEASKGAELFRLGYLGPFKEAFGLMGTSKGYSTSGQAPAPGDNRIVKEPTLIVAPSTDNRQAVDPKVAAQRSFQSFGGLKDSKIESEKAVTIAGLKGHQMVGEAVEPSSGARIGIYLLLLAGDPAGYYAIVGTSPIADMPKMLPEFEKVTASFEPLTPKK